MSRSLFRWTPFPARSFIDDDSWSRSRREAGGERNRADMRLLVKKGLLLTIVLQVAGCIDFAGESETLTPLPFTVTAHGTAFYGKNGIDAPGPVNQLCVGFLDHPIVSR